MTDHDTVIAAGTTVRARVRGTTDLIVEGRVEGPIEVDGSVVIGARAVVVGDIQAVGVHVAGTVVGNVSSFGPICLEDTAQVSGTIVTPRLSMSAGARVRGEVRTGDESTPQLRRRAEAPITQRKTRVSVRGADELRGSVPAPSRSVPAPSRSVPAPSRSIPVTSRASVTPSVPLARTSAHSVAAPARSRASDDRAFVARPSVAPPPIPAPRVTAPFDQKAGRPFGQAEHPTMADSLEKHEPSTIRPTSRRKKLAVRTRRRRGNE